MLYKCVQFVLIQCAYTQIDGLFQFTCTWIHQCIVLFLIIHISTCKYAKTIWSHVSLLHGSIFTCWIQMDDSNRRLSALFLWQLLQFQFLWERRFRMWWVLDFSLMWGLGVGSRDYGCVRVHFMLGLAYM